MAGHRRDKIDLDKLVTRARTLASAARQHDPGATASAYAALSETCVSCHAVYRDGRRPKRPESPADGSRHASASITTAAIAVIGCIHET
jgi:hypothetical protein